MRKLIFIFFLFSFVVKGQDPDSVRNKKPELSGYIKTMEQFSFIDSPDTASLSSLVHNRLNFKWMPIDHWLLRVEARNRIFYGDQIKANPKFMKAIGEDQGAMNLSKVWVDEYSVGVHSMIDRALINYSGKHLDVTVGRQRINWGLNMIWNPNDIFNTYNFFDFDYEERPGSDAVRVQYNWGGFSSVEFAAKKGKADDDHTAAMLFKGNSHSYDYQGMAGIYKKDVVLGLGWAGNIKEAGFKGEFSYFHPYENLADTSGILNGSVSFDYSFSNGLYVHLSGYYNSAGSDNLNLFSSQQFFIVNPKQLLPFKYAGFLQFSKQITPLFMLGLSNIYSPANDTWVIVPSAQYSIASNWEITLLGQSFFSDVNNVYRSLGNSAFLRFKFSF